MAMSQRKTDLRNQAGRKSGKRVFALVRSTSRCIANFAALNFVSPGLVVLCALALACWNLASARAQSSQDIHAEQNDLSDADKASYAEALAYCRGDVPQPMALRDDKRVLCINDWIFISFDFWTAYGLAQGGLVVIRSPGGEIATTTRLADLLLSKEATVVVNSYCLANCANYLFLASIKTFVPKDSLVAWRVVTDQVGECAGVSETNDGSVPHFEVVPCLPPTGDGRRNEYLYELKRKFYRGRVTPSFEYPPESITIRRILKRKFDQTGKYPADVYWTWNPRFYATSIKTKVYYEAYPRSQDEVEAIAAQIGLREPVVYDP
jgi:hypothetical protein